MVVRANRARLNLSIDPDLKVEVGEILDEIGLDYTTAINLYFNKIKHEQRIPFEISARRNLTVNEFLGSNWSEGLENLDDVWG
ncbi:type II toxin-antitoxin system RelB/DinJ family antitoxin [Streptococcus danieliae]|uniref:Type II toxin-antitoxin system RelB/DinJ family antitoxin n=1 Tax=Streptococcus danieliae TaxID=747656 RepID=A0A7Z0RRI6_9STRE|nr:type II toxin-antitoxin system RelB/DinJ family antitoxin [Streptococcus danieliae]MBF0717248.1 type II toxin-antitoxin system RelB/DinJ family antitoxin [Streptococcus danieliae]NYS49178.1 type II toxin-antitoxin system RelB/DinJ family antitoxin [Streptococcus danieliae]